MTPGITKHPFLIIILALILGGGFSGIQAQDAIKASLSTPANAGILSESCSGPFSLIIERGEENTDTILITISDFGVALMGVDYTFPNGTFPLEMLPEDTVEIIPITVIN